MKNGLNWRTKRASPTVLSMLSYTEKSKGASLAQGAQYVILYRKIKMCQFSSGNWIGLSIIAQFRVTGERRSNAVNLQKRL